MKRREVLALSAAAVAAPSVVRAQGTPGARSVLRFVPQTDLALLDPVFNTALVTRNHGMMVYDQLYGLDENYAPRPQLVEGHVVEDGGRTWRITLRERITFHDGTPIRAADAVASIARWSQADVLGQNIRAITDEMAAVSDRVFTIRLKKPFPFLAAALAKPSSFCPVMQERFAKLPVSTQVTEIVGSGPFRWVPGERMAGARAVYARFEGYVPRDEPPSFLAGGKRAGVDRVEWLTLPDASTAAAAMQQGEVDWWEQPTPDLLPLLRRNRNLRVEVKDRTGSMSMIRLNHLQPPFDNPAIRRAFLPGIRQADYMTAVLGEDRSLWNDRCGFFLPGSPLASEVGLDTMDGAPNFDRVKRNLEAAGYKGERVVFVVPADQARLNAMSEIAGDMFRRSGVNLDYQAGDWGTIAGRVNNRGSLEQGGWSVWCNTIPGIIATTPATQSYVRGPGRAGTYGWPDLPKIEALRDRFMDSEDLAEQKSLAEALQRQAFEDIPYLPTGFFTQPTAFRADVTGMLNGFPIFYNIRKG
ncbi:ABC transporter substrate-binding protein [Pararoseomonas indoligenes]|uniref:ABC transporter substrate-binding protein n=1 Tax=Roseomonas indoligenes TaxID=2820811 RepID=A0A940SAF9_9PROT|nr:ABC transporter substrate-binding protein [Pararoseomonas indoligenes]MBP0496152.1 ABC transporter substrate-binding protein [Pararoseomonas indoligenes]